MTNVLAGRNEDILYLDFDGVLHHENCYWRKGFGPYLVAAAKYSLFQNVDLLEELLTPYPNIKIVLSTSWVRRLRYSRTVKYLPSTIGARVVGATFHTRMNENDFLLLSRGMQIWSDVLRRQPAAWLALDDDHSDWPPWCVSNLVQTDESEGIADESVLNELKEKLKRFKK